MLQAENNILKNFGTKDRGLVPREEKKFISDLNH